MRLTLVCALSCSLSCSPATPAPDVAKPTTLAFDASAPQGPGFATPSKWTLAFSARWRSVSSIELDSGSTLEVGDGGERWIESVTGATEGAETLAPERLVGIQKLEGGGFRFVGASGAVYVAREPLGALSRGSAPVEGARQVAVGKKAILVVDGKGDLERSIDGGRSWNKIEVSKESVVIDVAMLGEKGILVTAPQRFYGTRDDGLTWTVAKSPGIGVQSLVARDGALWVDGVEESMRFDPAWGTFQQGSSPARTARRFVSTKGQQTISRIDGRRAIQVAGSGYERVWTLALGDGGVFSKPRKVDELDGCEMVDAAIRGDDIVFACDARGSVAGGIDKDATGGVPPRYSYGKNNNFVIDGGSLGWITRIVRSSDAGKTFREDTTIEGGIPQHGDASLAIGAEDFVYLGRRCGPGYNSACLPARVRASKSAGFSDVVEGDDTNVAGHARFASSGSQSSIYSLAMRDGEAFLYRWKSGSASPEVIGRVAGSIDYPSATLTIDDDGTVRGFARSGKDAFMFTYKEGGTIATTNLQVPVAHAAFAGVHGYGVSNAVGTTDPKAYESTDGGKTWGVATSPAYVGSIDACSTFGCVTDRGVRWGWDAPTTTSADGGTAEAVAASKPQYEKPLRCSAKDRWIELGGGNIPTVSSVDHGANRWVLPTRDKDGKIALVISKRGESTTKATSVPLLGAPPPSPKFGSGTTVHVQPDGVVALRYSYVRERKGPGRYNPVDAQMAWYRDSNGKVSHATANKNPPFRVNKDPQGGYDRDAQPSFSELPEVLALAQSGLYFRAASYPEEDANGEPKPIAIQLFRDDGKIEKLKVPDSLSDANGTAFMATIDGTTELFARSPENWAATNMSDGKRTFYSVLGGLGDDDGVVDLIRVDGKPAFAATLRDPARAWIIGLKAEPELGAFTPIATQKSIGDVPKACDGAPDPNGYRVDAPYVFGSRRPVVVDSDGVAIVLATDRAEIRGTAGSPDACVAAFDATIPAQDDDKDFGALIFTDDLAHSLLFRADASAWPATIAVRSMECQYQAGPLPEELETVEGFTPDSRHAALARKRY